jgi:hypothetical protein
MTAAGPRTAAMIRSSPDEGSGGLLSCDAAIPMGRLHPPGRRSPPCIRKLRIIAAVQERPRRGSLGPRAPARRTVPTVPHFSIARRVWNSAHFHSGFTYHQPSDQHDPPVSSARDRENARPRPSHSLCFPSGRPAAPPQQPPRRYPSPFSYSHESGFPATLLRSPS